MIGLLYRNKNKNKPL